MTQRRPHQKVVALSDLSPQERVEIADRLDAEFSAIFRDLAARQEPLGAEFEAALGNMEELYEP